MRKAGRKEPHDYELYDDEGTRVGVVRQVDTLRRSSALRKITNFFEWTSTLPDVSLEVIDLHGTLLLTVHFSGEDAQYTATVHDGSGNEIGVVAKARGLRKIHFDLKIAGFTQMTVEAEGWSGWDYLIKQGGTSIGRITQLREPFLGIPMTSDDHLLELGRAVAEPLHTLVVACAVGMDLSVSRAPLVSPPP